MSGDAYGGKRFAPCEDERCPCETGQRCSFSSAEDDGDEPLRVNSFEESGDSKGFLATGDGGLLRTVDAHHVGHVTDSPKPATPVKPVLLDLFCGAGGAAMGYSRAGFDVIGVDIEPQPNYPFAFYQADALEVLELLVEDAAGWGWGDIDAIHASPPCQAYSKTARLWKREAPRLIEPVRRLIHRFQSPYVIENVEDAPLVNPVILCGSSFGLAVRRHRLFECDPFWVMAPPCQHPTEPKYPTHARKDKAQLSPFVQIYGTGGGAGKDINLWRWAMDVPWMQTKKEIAEAIPPAYTEFIGHQLLAHLDRTRRESGVAA